MTHKRNNTRQILNPIWPTQAVSLLKNVVSVKGENMVRHCSHTNSIMFLTGEENNRKIYWRGFHWSIRRHEMMRWETSEHVTACFLRNYFYSRYNKCGDDIALDLASLAIALESRRKPQGFLWCLSQYAVSEKKLCNLFINNTDNLDNL